MEWAASQDEVRVSRTLADPSDVAVIISHSFIYGKQSFDLSRTGWILKTNAGNLANKFPKLSIALPYRTDLLLIASHKERRNTWRLFTIFY